MQARHKIFIPEYCIWNCGRWRGYAVNTERAHHAAFSSSLCIMGLRLRIANQRTAYAGAVTVTQQFCKQSRPRNGSECVKTWFRVSAGSVVNQSQCAETNIGVARISDNTFFYHIKRIACRALVAVTGDGHNGFDSFLSGHNFIPPIIQPRTMRRSSVSIKRFSHCFFAKKCASSSMALKHRGALTSVSVHNSCATAFFCESSYTGKYGCTTI